MTTLDPQEEWPWVTDALGCYLPAETEDDPCPYCAEGLPLDATGWHIREPGPDDLEGIQRIPCAKL